MVVVKTECTAVASVSVASFAAWDMPSGKKQRSKK
jgi:hypothetical protein